MLFRAFAWVLAVLPAGGRHDNLEPTDLLAPPGYKGNPWGPAAAHARENGELPPIVMTTKMEKWDKWGRAVLKEGDIVFRRGDAKVLFGQFPFSRWLANCSNSPFSHTAIVAIEDGAPVIYDTTHSSVRRQPFCVWVLDNVGDIGVKRPKAANRGRIPAVIAFCRKLWLEQPPFDFELNMDDTAYYCLEMTEKAYRAAGLPLSRAIRIGDMENAPQYPITLMMFQTLTPWVLKHGLTLETEIYLPGNETHGIWASPALETVYPKGPLALRPPGAAKW